MELRGATAIVTGASRGIGRAIAEALAAEGMRLVLNARTAGPLADVATALRAKGTLVEAVAGDIAEESTASTLVETATAQGGRLDVVINNAGLGHHGPLEKMEPAEFDRCSAPICAVPSS